MRFSPFAILLSSVMTITSVVFSQSTPATGSMTVSGTEQSKQVLVSNATSGKGNVTISGTERSFHSYDTGVVSITVNGFTKSTTYGGEPGTNNTSAKIAAALVNLFNADTSSPVSTTLSGSIVNITAKQAGASTNYTLSAASYTTNSGFSGTSFPATPSGSTLTGGTDAVYNTLYDTGNATVTVNGFSKTQSYGQGSTSSGIVTGLASLLNGDSTSPVTAGASSSTLTLTSKAVGYGANYSLSCSTATTNSNFSVASFSCSDSGATLTGGKSIPNITPPLSPSGAAEGTPVTVSGVGFGPTQGTSTVSLNGTNLNASAYSSWSDTSIQFTVPSPAYTGNVVVTVNGISSNGVLFTVAPTITSLSVNQGNIGAPVTVNGRNLGGAPGSVTFGNSNVESQLPQGAATTSWSSGSVGTSVPGGALTGGVIVTANGMNSNSAQFTVTPRITGITPNSSGTGLSITIDGANFNNSQGSGTLTFNQGSVNVTPTISLWNDDGIAAVVPTGLAPGSVNVQVNQNGMMSGTGSFVLVNVPQISSLSQTSGTSGTAITITGNYFGTSGAVSFNGAAANATSWNPGNLTTNGTIGVVVPYGIATGPVVVRNFGGSSSGVTFNVTNSFPGPVAKQIETGNNTSNQGNFGGLGDFRTNDTNTDTSFRLAGPILTSTFDPQPGHVADGDVHTLYSDSNGNAVGAGKTKIFVETQEWFCTNDGTPVSRDYNPSAGANDQNKHTFPQCGDHADVGYISNTNAQAAKAIAEMHRRGFDGFIADTSGAPNDCQSNDNDVFGSACTGNQVATDSAIQAMKSSLINGMSFALIEDESAFTSTAQSGVGETCFQPLNPSSGLPTSIYGQGGTSQPLCVAQKILADIKYYGQAAPTGSGYFPSSNYLKDPTGNPLLFFFVAEGAGSNFDFHQCTASSGSGSCAVLTQQNTTSGSCGGTDSTTGVNECWTEIWNAVAALAPAAAALAPPLKINMIFREPSTGFLHVQSGGTFGWVNPNECQQGKQFLNITEQIAPNTEEDWKQIFGSAGPNSGNSPSCEGVADTADNNYVDAFYSAAANALTANPATIVFGVAKKGFDDENKAFGVTSTNSSAGTGQGKVTSQQCGTVWLNSFKEPATSGKFGSNNPIPYIMVGTWDDYDEGSEIETGIDNCLSLSASITGVQGGVNSTLLAWAPSFSDTTTGTENTVSSYTVYDYNSGTGNLTAKAVSLPTTVHSVDVASLNLSGSGPVNGTHTLYVEAVGKPSIFNHLSPDPGVSWVAGYGRGSVTLEGCTGYDTLGNCTAIDPSIPAPYDNGSIAIQISGGSAGTCNVSVPYYAHAPREGLRDLVDKLSSAIASTPSCSSFVSAFPQANVLFLQSTAAGSTTNYTFQSSHAGTSILTIDSNGGVFRGGQ